jgi:hypothetical protein
VSQTATLILVRSQKSKLLLVVVSSNRVFLSYCSWRTKCLITFISRARCCPWGRLFFRATGDACRAHGWQSNLALREMALEQARIVGFPHRPSRLDSVFVMLTVEEARKYREKAQGFALHLLYRVSLQDPTAPSHTTDTRLCGPAGAIRPNWADAYWMDADAQAAALPGVDWNATQREMLSREMLTLSPLRIEECLDPPP